MILYPKAEHSLTGVTGGTMVGGTPRGVLHTTETSPRWFFTAKTYYHLQVREWEGSVYWRQFIDLAAASRALFNGPLPVQTNRQGSVNVNVAIVGYAKNSPHLSDLILDELAEFFIWAETELGIPATFPLDFGGGETYGPDGAGRLTVPQWKEITGWVGHQDVPDGNTHWDPGRIPVDKLTQRITQKGADDMTHLQARLELATAWHAVTGRWMDGVDGEDPAQRLTRLAEQVRTGARTVEDIVRFATPSGKQPENGPVPAWVLDRETAYSELPVGGTVDLAARTRIDGIKEHLRRAGA